MPKLCYIDKNFRGATLDTIKKVNGIIATYQAQGYSLTLRQVFYQMVSRDWLANTQKNYSKLGNVINDARLAGYIDWDAIEDRTRNLHRLDMWSDPQAIIRYAAGWYLTDKWRDQDYRVEVWIEKEALAGVFERVCDEVEVPFFACRGYTSQSEMWRAAMRLKRWEDYGFKTVILHFGDHDPSGIDMSRDIMDRLSEISVPTLALCGSDDIMTPPKYSHHLVEKLPEARAVVIDGGTHMVFAEKPEEVNSAIAEFLQEL